MTIEPDTKDWTWVLDQHCPDCGFDAWATPRSGLADAVAGNARRMAGLLGSAAGPAQRPRPSTWSLLEYGAHVRDVHLVFTDRLLLMLGQTRRPSPTGIRTRPPGSGATRSRRPLRWPPRSRPAASGSPPSCAPSATMRGTARACAATDRASPSRTLARYALHDLVHHWHDVTGERADRETEGATPMTDTIPAGFADLLENPNLGALATIRSDGAPSITPMWFLWENGQLLFTHTTYRAKIAELQATPLATLMVLDPENRQRYIQVRGRLAGITADPTGAFYQRLARRYGAADPAPPRDAADRVIIALDPVGSAASGNA